MLIPLDGSPLSRHVLPYAKKMASRMGCEVTFLHVLELKLMHSYELNMSAAVKYIGLAHDEAESYLLELVEDFHKAGIKASYVIKQEMEPAEAIVKYIHQNAVDVVAMTTHGRSGIKQLLLGSVANHLIHSTTIPIVLIRPEHAEK
jgi:nucleotide-binding universal stress UspA family protein